MINSAYLWSKILKKSRMSAVRNSDVHRTSKVESGSHVVNSSMGRHSFCGYDCEIYHCDVGSFTSIANRVVVGGGVHPMEWVAMSPVFYEGRDSVRAKFAEHKRPPPQRTTIGHDVWIGQNVLIRQGVSIGNGAVVGMGSVVTRDVEDYAVVAGSPARMLRKRFDDDTIRALLEVRWWDFSDEMLARYARYFTDPREFLQQLAQR